MSGIRVYILRIFWLIPVPVGVRQVEYVSLAMENSARNNVPKTHQLPHHHPHHRQ